MQIMANMKKGRRVQHRYPLRSRSSCGSSMSDTTDLSQSDDDDDSAVSSNTDDAIGSSNGSTTSASGMNTSTDSDSSYFADELENVSHDDRGSEKLATKNFTLSGGLRLNRNKRNDVMDETMATQSAHI